MSHCLRSMAAALLLSASLTTPAFALTGTVDSDGSPLRVRQSASTSAAVLDMLVDGKKVEITDTSVDGWYGIDLKGRTGYVSASYIALTDGNAEAVPAAPAAESTPAQTQAEPAEESFYVRVTAGPLNVRAGAGTGYDKVGSIAKGKIVKVLATQDGWYKLSSGYILAEYTEPATAEEAADDLYIRVAEGPLNIRSGPGTGYSKVGSLYKGRIVKALGLEGGWYRIEGGYVSAEHVEETDYAPVAATSTGGEMANFALQYVGYSYVYGGSSPSVGFDCSGLVQYVCAQFGYSINRTASAQLDNGVAVMMDELAAGDLVFFKKPGSNTTKPVTHVGMYIGGGQFVHASDYGVGVIVSNMTDAYYTTGFVAARRVAV